MSGMILEKQLLLCINLGRVIGSPPGNLKSIILLSDRCFLFSPCFKLCDRMICKRQQKCSMFGRISRRKPSL